MTLKRTIILLFLLATSVCFSGDEVTVYKPDAKGFITDWLICGPFPSYRIENSSAGKGYNTDFLTKQGGEQNIQPRKGVKEKVEFIADISKLIAEVGATNEWGFKESRHFTAEWKELKLPEGEFKIKLNGLFPPIKDYLVAYAACYIISNHKQAIKLRVGSDDDNKVFLNGKFVGGANTSQDIKPDSFIYKAILKRGVNFLLVKIVDRTMGHGFCLAVSTRDDKPLRDIKICLSSPVFAIKEKFPAIKKVDAWYNGYALSGISSKNYWTGANTLKSEIIFPEKAKYDLNFKVKNRGNKTVFSNKIKTDGTPGKIFAFSEKVKLPGKGKYTVEVEISSGTPVRLQAVLETDISAYDEQDIKKEIQVVNAKNEEAQRQVARLKKEAIQLQGTVKKLQKERLALWAKMEKVYSRKRKENADKYNVAGMSQDVPFNSTATMRSKWCLNGDQWQIASGKYGNHTTKKFHSPPNKYWKNITVPVLCFPKYFRFRFYPVENVDPKNRHTGAIKPVKGWEGFKFENLLCENKLWFRKKLKIDFPVNKNSATFICENIEGNAKFFLNGKYEGAYKGNIGLVEIPLKNLKLGENVLDIYMESPGPQTPDLLQMRGRAWGIQGDVWLEFSSPVRTEFVLTKTSWRKNQFTTETTIENRTDTPQKIQLKQYAVLNNRIKKQLPDKEISMAANSSDTVKNKVQWNDPELWGIGGKYGKPVLYQLYTDIYQNGKLVDRQITTFGFREVWIAGTDFFYNGKRLIVQGDVGHYEYNRKRVNIILPLLRKDGINTIRTHDSRLYRTPEFFNSCDKLGMFVYAQMYPILYSGVFDVKMNPAKKAWKQKKLTSGKEWFKGKVHQQNLKNYRAWVKIISNHPSVIILSTDNEVYTQSQDVLAWQEFNKRNDKLAAWYGKYVKSIAPGYIMTRDGDVGTWGLPDKWQESPPCDTANYHYPDFHIDRFVRNWQTVFGFRPVIYGETLYCAYGAWNGWIGPIPSQVTGKAAKVFRVASLYKDLEIPGQIYMGLSLDGFIRFDNTGKGNPWGITAKMIEQNRIPQFKGYPWAEVKYPVCSGPALPEKQTNVNLKRYGSQAVNWFDPDYPSHIRNEVNDAYRAALRPMPPLAKNPGAECIVELPDKAKNKIVTIHGKNREIGAVTDNNGKAYFSLPEPGQYIISCENEKRTVNIPGAADYITQPGFDKIPRYTLKGK